MDSQGQGAAATGSILGKTIPEQIVNAENDLPNQFEQHGEERCVLFADLVGSTDFKHSHGERKGIGKSHLHNQIATKSVQVNGGVVVKYTGDGLMATFAGPDRCARALDAGLGLVEEIKRQNGDPSDPDNSRRFPHDLSTRVGINDGRVWLFQYPQSTVPDPQGRTVDVAARLCAMASPMQLLCSARVFEQARDGSQFENHSKSSKRFIRGVPESVTIVAVAPTGWEVAPIPFAGHFRPESPAASRQRQQAYERFLNNDVDGALKLLRGIIGGSREMQLEKDEGNFHANLQAAELLLFHVRWQRRDFESVAKEAEGYLYHAKMVRDRCSKAWLLLGWLRIKEYEHSHEPLKIGRAIEYFERARRLAEDEMNTDGVRNADIYRMYALTLRVKHGEEERQRAEDLDLADRLGQEIGKSFMSSVGFRRAQYLSAHALVKIEKGDATNPVEAKKIAKMIADANKYDPTSELSLAAISEICQVLKQPWGALSAEAGVD